MLIGSNRGAGMNIGFPDVCLTPPLIIPIPYPNFAANAMAVLFSPIVMLTMMPALNLGSIIAMTTGDEPGVAHPTVMGIGTYVMGNPIVFVEKLPGICLTCPTMGNKMNNPVGAVLVPSATNVFYTRRPKEGLVPPAGALSVDALLALGRASDVGGAEAVPPGAMLTAKTGYLAVRLFSAEVQARAHHEIGVLLRGGMEALVLDLRGCPGGELSAALRLAADFLENGQVVARVVDAEGDEIAHRARVDGPHRIPLAVLVDGETASAAEVLAGALQANGRAVLVGTRTYGKGTAQEVVQPLWEPSARYATTATCLLPDGRGFDGVGLLPDVEVVMGGDARAVAVRALEDMLRGAAPASVC